MTGVPTDIYAFHRSRVLAVIPARYASTRLPGKPLLRETGKYLIQHVIERVRQADRIDEVVVATDDERIVAVVQSFGGTAVMTSPHHRSGTDRTAEVARGRPDIDVVINVQGDEPLISPDALDTLVDLVATRDSTTAMATLARPFEQDEDPADENAVKVVRDSAGDALYFSRALIPFGRQGNESYLLHLGLYAWRREVLLHLVSLPQSPLEVVESLEQLRALENGIRIRVGVVSDGGYGIDTPADYARFVNQVSAHPS